MTFRIATTIFTRACTRISSGTNCQSLSARLQFPCILHHFIATTSHGRRPFWTTYLSSTSVPLPEIARSQSYQCPIYLQKHNCSQVADSAHRIVARADLALPLSPPVINPTTPAPRSSPYQTPANGGRSPYEAAKTYNACRILSVARRLQHGYTTWQTVGTRKQARQSSAITASLFAHSARPRSWHHS